MRAFRHKHLLGMSQLSVPDIELILDTAESLREISRREIKKVPTLRGKSIVHFFYEPSTRTRTSFEMAAKRLSADTVSLSATTSSMTKGETLIDTARNLQAMNPDLIVLRHSASGAPHLISQKVDSGVINAGDGINEHPSQALLDLFTIRDQKGGIKGLKVLIMGDIAHSRVARSNIIGLTKMGAEVTVCGPATMIPPHVESLGARTALDPTEAVRGKDVIMDSFVTFGFSFLINSIIALVIVRGIYYPSRRSKEYVLTFLTFNTLMFLIASLLSGVDLSVGFGFSLFAIFSILRYRTDPIPIREMTYLFVMMALPAVNAILVAQGSFGSLAIADSAVVLVLFLVEKEWGTRYVSHRSITYERVDLVKPEKYQELLADLRARTGLDITRCEIGKIDFLRDIADIKVYYTEPEEQIIIVQSTGEPEAEHLPLYEQEWHVAPEKQTVKIK